MSSEFLYSSQSRLNFDIDSLLEMGISRAYVTPFSTNNECLANPQTILTNLEKLAEKAELAATKGLEVYPFFVTINHPEGNYEIPSRYRRQQNLDGSQRPAFICFRDAARQAEMVRLAARAAELGFSRIAFDDDLRDAFCYCDEHLNGFEGFRGKTRRQVARILNGVLTSPEHEQLRLEWYRFKYEGLKDFALRVVQTVRATNPDCRIGLCVSAKRCHDFSGRHMRRWLELFHSDQAPSFVRLCGECYDDQISHLVQSTGWHMYTHRSFPVEIERCLEITSVSGIDYRSSATVVFEGRAVVAATAQNRIHWAWTEDFACTGLDRAIGPARRELAEIFERTPSALAAPLALYVDHELGPYTPPEIAVDYGATHDPMTGYNIISLLGLPIVPTPSIPPGQSAIVSCAYISRRMIEKIDHYVSEGGVAILDATAARCYRVYDGQVEFDIDGPRSLHRYELDPGGGREETIADCPPDSIYWLAAPDECQVWTAYDISGNRSGVTTAVIPHGRGKLVVLGFDLSRIGMTLVRPEWRTRLLKMLSAAGVNPPVHWTGPVAVQVFYYGQKTALVNYSTSQVEGALNVHDKPLRPITLEPREICFV